MVLLRREDLPEADMGMNPSQKGGQHTGSGQQNTWSEIMSDGLGERKEDSQRKMLNAF